MQFTTALLWGLLAGSVVAATCTAFADPEAAAKLTFDNGFETGNLAGFQCSGNCPTVVTDPVAGGKFAGDFDLNRSMSTPYRTEVVLKESGKFEWLREYWVGLSFRFEEWAVDQDMEIAPFQIHPTPMNWEVDPKCNRKSQISNGPVMMAVQEDEMRVYTFGGVISWRAPIVRKQWMHLVLHFTPSTGNDGLIEMWKDGEKIVRVTGQNSHAEDLCGNAMRPPYWKMGIYKWNWQAGRPATASTRRRLLLDNLKIAEGSDGLALVNPEAVHKQ